MKRKALMLAAVAVVALAAVFPASAQSVREETCTTEMNGVTVTYDCGFNVKNYVTGTPVTITVGYTCSASCGPVMSFGLRDRGFSPGGVAGHMVSGRRGVSGLELTFVFDSLKKTGNGAVGNAHFAMGLMIPDGSGGLAVMPCPVDVHLGESN